MENRERIWLDMSENYKFFKNEKCEFFPCHDVEDIENFNCLFCYCPLYALGTKCGGNFKYNDMGIKDCKNCLIPHKRSGYEYIISKFSDISKLARER